MYVSDTKKKVRLGKNPERVHDETRFLAEKNAAVVSPKAFFLSIEGLNKGKVNDSDVGEKRERREKRQTRGMIIFARKRAKGKEVGRGTINDLTRVSTRMYIYARP